ncbi:hypothetical protein P5673_003576 [Acropora cervicornis]|uniref:Uncharacterized protein n=1 Tax=Acropora cervicornis TaxID=6130 RepID=A0AAD9R0Z6_ACRCE|nr:hypothetical protein P5673_003576 [Acropora cervicornis]
MLRKERRYILSTTSITFRCHTITISPTFKPSTETAHLAVTLISFTEERQVPYVRHVNGRPCFQRDNHLKTQPCLPKFSCSATLIYANIWTLIRHGNTRYFQAGRRKEVEGEDSAITPPWFQDSFKSAF